jgi:hypothetical protein
MVKAILGLVFLASTMSGGDEELDKAAAKAAAMENYTAKISTKLDGLGKKGGTGMPATDVQVVKDAPVHFKNDQVEAYRSGETVVTKEGEAWTVLGRPEKPAQGEKPDRKLIAMQTLRTMKLPHEMFKDLGAKIKEVKREDSDGGKCFSGELTPEAAKELGSIVTGRGGGNKEPAIEFTGSIKVYVNGEGSITKVEIHTEGKGTVKEKEIVVKQDKTIELSEVGSTKSDVPEEAKKALGN